MNIGVYISDCGGQISRRINLANLEKALSREDAAVKIVKDFYLLDEIESLLSHAKKHNLDGVVLAGDSPLSYSHARKGRYLFSCLSQLGINSNRIEPVNLINFVALPHNAEPEELLEKALLMIQVGMEKVRHSKSVQTVEVAPRKSVAVIGAGVASLSVSQNLLDQGYKVHWVNREEDFTIPDQYRSILSPTLAFVLRHPRFIPLTHSVPRSLFGFPGDYSLAVKNGDMEKEISVGAVVLTFEEGAPVIKNSQTIFRLDIKEDGSVASLDDMAARSQTMEAGVFLVNPHSDAEGVESLILASDAAASRVANLLSKTEIQHDVSVSQVDAELCGACGVCVKTCMFDAITIRKSLGVSDIDIRKCRGCGNCVTVCPTGARDLVTSPSRYLYKAVDVLSRFQPADNTPRILLLACEGCGYPCLDRAAQKGMTWPVSVMELPVVCGGQIDTQLILHGFVRGFDAVVLMICGEGCCHNIIGNVDLERRVNLLRSLLYSRNIDPDRLHIIATCARDGEACVEGLNQFYDTLAKPDIANSAVFLKR